MGAAVSASGLDSLGDKDVAALESTYLKIKMDGASGAPLLELLQREAAELIEKKKAQAQAASSTDTPDVISTLDPPSTVSAPVVTVSAPEVPEPTSETTKTAEEPKETLPGSAEATPSESKTEPKPSSAPAVPPDSQSTSTAVVASDQGSPSALDAARMRVMTLMRSVTVEAWSNFMVACDASAPSKLAVEVCLQELMSSKDGLIALHIYDSTKKNSELEDRFKASNLREDLEVQLMTRTGKGRYSLKWVDKAGDSTSNCAVRTVNKMSMERDNYVTSSKHQKSMDAPSYFLTGVSGRKGKELGSLPLLAACKLHLPNIIIKRPPVVDRGRVFVIAMKHSDQDDLYDVALDLMKPGKGDTMVVLHMYQETYRTEAQPLAERESTKTIALLSSRYEALFASDGVTGKFVAIEKQKDAAFKSATILEALASEEADYVIIQPSLKPSGMEISQCTQDIIVKSRCNIVCCRH